MNDTSFEIAMRFRNMIMKLNPEERLSMGFSMYDTAKKIVENAIINKKSGIKPQNLKKEIFLRFYGMEFSEDEKKKILRIFK